MAKRAVLFLILAAVVAHQGASSFAGAAAGEPPEKVEPLLLEKVAGGGETVFWVVLHEEANLAPAFGRLRRAERGAFVHDKLNEVANRTQAPLRVMLDARVARFKPFWIINAIRVTGGESLLLEIAARPEVKAIYDDRTYRIPAPQDTAPEPRVNSVEWNVDRIRAPHAWSTFDDRGEGIVVANIDTGVQYRHPALVRQYRGHIGGGSFNHNYSWFDPSHVCGNPSLAPCDNNGHGTHTMGTMVGDDGGANQIGVAPHAKWIAAKGCESGSCSLAALLASGQRVLAPTDLNGNRPRPDLRPHVVNNSWGGGPGDPFYAAIVDAWVASGIFPAFANGNSGSGCGSSGSPGDYVASYSAGAFDITTTSPASRAAAPRRSVPGR